MLTPPASGRSRSLLGILDDRSRLCCHLQWYLDETADSLIHGLSQPSRSAACRARSSPTTAPAMLAAETAEGLERLGIVHHTTLPYSPEQNGKQESFWGQIEGRLLPMLEGEPGSRSSCSTPPRRPGSSRSTTARYTPRSRSRRSTRYLRGPLSVAKCPSSDALRRAFRTEVTRTQRRSDGTVTVEGIRFEVPSAYRALVLLRLRVARWDLVQRRSRRPTLRRPPRHATPIDKRKTPSVRDVFWGPRVGASTRGPQNTSRTLGVCGLVEGQERGEGIARARVQRARRLDEIPARDAQAEPESVR